VLWTRSEEPAACSKRDPLCRHLPAVSSLTEVRGRDAQRQMPTLSHPASRRTAREWCRHQHHRAFTGPGAGCAHPPLPLIVPGHRGILIDVAGTCLTDQVAEAASLPEQYTVTTSSRRPCCQDLRSPETEQTRLLQGVAPPTSLYRVPPLPAVHTAFLPWAWFPSKVIQTAASLPSPELESLTRPAWD